MRHGAWPDVGGRRAFTLLELLVVIAIIATLMGILVPALGSSRAEGTKIKCLANLRELGMAMQMYSDDDLKNFTSPVHPKAECNWIWDGEYEYGGRTGFGVYGNPDFVLEKRVLNRYIFRTPGNVRLELYECPTDTGIPPAPYDFDPYFFIPGGRHKKCHEFTGTSYRLNNHIDFTGNFPQFRRHFYGPYMRSISHVPDPAVTVILEEAIAEVAKWNSPDYLVMGWHRKFNVFNVLFLDGHAGAIHLAGQSDNSAQYPNYWVLRGFGWRMDCYPRPPICDKYSGSSCGHNCAPGGS